jgi:hypothetical protein
MNEARQMHEHLVNTLLPIIPRPVYQDCRRLDTLVWAQVGPMPDPHGACLSLGRDDSEPR